MLNESKTSSNKNVDDYNEKLIEFRKFFSRIFFLVLFSFEQLVMNSKMNEHVAMFCNMKTRVYER